MRTGFLIILLLLIQSTWAQVLLRPSGHVSNEYIFQFTSENSALQNSQSFKHNGLRKLRQKQNELIDRLLKDTKLTDLILLRNLWIKQSVAVSISDRYIPKIMRLNYVKEIRRDKQYKLQPQGVTTLPITGALVQDNLAEIDIDRLWENEYKGQGVVVAILDSGVDVKHEDLSDRWRGGTNSWFDAYGEQSIPVDLSGHGTGVASIVLGGNATGTSVGVAPNAQWIAARIFDDSGNSTESAISETLQWIIDPDGNPNTDDYPDIVQNSWGLDSSEGQCINPFAQELQAINSLGIDIVFAVGNSGLSGLGQGGFSSYLTPAFDDHVISVGALKQDGNLLFTSSRGPNVCGNTVIPMFVAPGENINTADLTFGGFDTNNTTINDGTSFSSPHISGALALLRSRHLVSDHLNYRDALNQTATNLGDSEDYGHGLIQVATASDQIQDQQAPLTENEISFTLALYQFDEDSGSVDVRIQRTGNLTSEASLTVTSEDGTATSPDDYQAVSTNLIFEPGESYKKLAIQLANDDEQESSETFKLLLSQNVNINLGQKTTLQVSIKDDDSSDDSEESTIGGASMTPGMLLILALLGIFNRRRHQ